MVESPAWFSRRFTFDLEAGAYPALLERLRGTPLRLEERLAGLDRATLTTRVDGRWSIQEHAGHLLDLEALWAARLDDFERGVERLTAADLQNRRTDEAHHNERTPREILDAFRAARGAFLRRLESVDDALVTRSALHPRLAQPMRLVDHVLFVAEHDDHHLATISVLRRRRPG